MKKIILIIAIILLATACKTYKQVEIVKMLNIPQYKVSRIKSRALIKIKKCINNNVK